MSRPLESSPPQLGAVVAHAATSGLFFRVRSEESERMNTRGHFIGIVYLS